MNSFSPNTQTYHFLIDVDGTLAYQMSQISQFIENEHGITIPPSEFTEWDLYFPRLEKELGDVIQNIFQMNRGEWFLTGMDPMENASFALQTLIDNGHTIDIATHRPPDTHKYTELWLSENNIPYHSIIEEVPQNKGLLDGDVLIDDYHRNVQNAINSGMHGVLFESPFSQQKDCQDAIAISNWTDFINTYFD